MKIKLQVEGFYIIYVWGSFNYEECWIRREKGSLKWLECSTRGALFRSRSSFWRRLCSAWHVLSKDDTFYLVIHALVNWNISRSYLGKHRSLSVSKYSVKTCKWTRITMASLNASCIWRIQFLQWNNMTSNITPWLFSTPPPTIFLPEIYFFSSSYPCESASQIARLFWRGQQTAILIPI